MNRELFDRTPARKRSREDILRAVREAAEPAAASFGLEVWGIELAGAGRPVVRIYVDAPVSMREPDAPFLSAGDDAPGVQGGAGVEQCAEISRMVGLALDVEEIFPDAWTLEIPRRVWIVPFSTLPRCFPIWGGSWMSACGRLIPHARRAENSGVCLSAQGRMASLCMWMI